METVVYTALFGGYYPAIPAVPDLGVPCVAFTDGPGLKAPGWDIATADLPGDSRMAAKWFKLHPHELFPDHEASIWLDAGWQIVNPAFARECAAYLVEGGPPAVFYPHRWRTTVRAELSASTHLKFAGLPLREQVESYLAQGFPDDGGLLECTSLLRRHHELPVVELGQAWWDECARWSHADQLSLPYLLWRLATPYAVFPFNLEGQPWFRLAHWRDD